MKTIPCFLSALFAFALLFCAASASVVSIGNGEVTTIGGTATVDLVLDEAPDGLAGYSINVSIANPNIARVSSVSYPAWAGLTDTSALPSSDCKIKATDTEEQVQSNATGITLATVTIEGIAGGTTGFNLVVNMMNDDNDTELFPSTVSGTFITNVPVAPTAEFTASPTSGVAPLTVQFTDQSTADPTGWSWDFGDGGTSNERNPSHSYDHAGTYTVNLTATNAYGSGTESKEGFVTVAASYGTLVREWTFESGTVEGFTPVSTWGSGMTVSTSATSHGGSYALECYANNGIGYATAPLVLPPNSNNFRLEYWVRSSATGYGYTDVGISIVDADGALIVKMDGSDYDIRITDHSVICNRPPGAWVRHVVEWSKTTGVIDHYAYDASGTLLGSAQITRAETAGKTPAEVWCKIRGLSVAHTIQYDDIVISSDSPGWVAPVAAFTSDVQSGTVPLDVQFTDQSANDPVFWSWDFGDGTSSTEQDPLHTYNEVGTYTVSLTATNYGGSDSEEKTGYVAVNVASTPPVAAFTTNTTTGLIPLHVQFTDQSTGKPLSWSWDFGDGANSTERNPSHVYITAGNYTVTLTATNGAGPDDETVTIFAVATAADFSADTTSGPAPWTIHFTDLSTGSPTSWSWDFGDGCNSTEQNPTHEYAAAGNYTVSLTTTKGEVVNSITKADYIIVTPTLVPDAEYTASRTAGPVPFFVRFTDTSTNYPTSWSWDFGDSGTSTAQSPGHTYMAEGIYTVTLTATNSAGSDTETKIGLINVTAGSGESSGPWSKFQSDRKNTGQFPYAGPEAGNEVWNFTTGGDIRYAGPAVGADGTVYFGSYDDKVYAVNPDGSFKWSYTTGGDIYGTPAIGPDGTVYIGSYDAKLYALNPDGSQKWNYTTGARIYGSPAIGADGTVYVGSYDKKFYAINPDGSEKWNYTAGNYFYYSSPAIAEDGTVYIGNRDKNLYAFNPDGTLRWSYATGNYIYGSPAIGADGTIYVGSYDKSFYALNPDGTLKWSYTIGNYIYGSPAIAADGTIYIGGYDSNLYAFNPDGTLLWSYATGGRIYGSPAIAGDGGVFFGCYDGKVYAVNSDGSQRWNFSTGSNIYGSAAFGADGTLYIGSNDDKLHAFYTGHVAPVADFTSSTETSDLLSPVRFTDTSANFPTSWSWDFGDGGTSAEQNPVHTYTTPGTYTVTLTATNAQGTDIETKTGYITKEIPAAPVAGFTAEIGSGVSQVQVRFTDQSTGIIPARSWDFGDGATSTDQNPSHWYVPGDYTVTLTVTNSGGINSCPQNLTVSSAGAAIIKQWTFESGTEEGFTPVGTWGNGMTVSVSPTAHGGSYALQCYASQGMGYAEAPLENVPDADSYQLEYWMQSSNTGYGYTETGIMIVDAEGNLIVKNTGGDYDIRASDHNTVICSRPTAEWLFCVIQWDKNTGVIDHYIYDANGVLLGSAQVTLAGTVGKIPAKARCYVRGYTVAHTILYDDIALSRNLAPPVAAFTSDIQAGISPLTVHFTDQSTHTPTAWSWDFGDGGTSTDQNPAHTYSIPGTYTVTLTATNADGSDSEEKTGCAQVYDPSHPTVLITPQLRNVPIGTTRDFSLSMTSLPSGLAGYNLSVSLSDPGAGEITAITLPAWASLNMSSDVPGDSVWASGLDLTRAVEAGATNVPLGTVTVRGDTIGSSPFVVMVAEMDADGGDTITPVVVSGVLNVYQPVPLAVDFSADNTTGYFPLTVRFTDLSTGVPAPSAWNWSFGDTTVNSTERIPLHTYSQPGQYSVTLTVSNDLEQVTVTKAGYITVMRHVVPFPGCENEPLDPDHDGRYEDINGNGRLDFHDVVTLYQNMQWVRDNTEVGVEPFDFNGNGRLDYDDIVLLYYEVLAG